MKKIELCKIYVDAQMKKVITNVLDSGRYIKGEQNKKFESEFAELCSVKHGVTVNSGTAALLLSLIALGIKKDDEVILPSHTFIATASVVLHLRAKPVFVDIDPETYTLSIDDVKKKITKKTKAIIPVHLYGHPVDMDRIVEVAEENNLKIIEDACQAHGAIYKGKKIGGIGDIGCFSFFPSKVMTVCGDGGMVTTNNKEIAEKIGMLRDQGRKKGEKYSHELLGFNFRLSELHAAIGRVQLKHLPDFIEKRRKIAKKYNKEFKDMESIVTPKEKNWAKHVYYVYTIRVKKRDEIVKYLNDKGIATGIYYPIPVHKQPCVAKIVKPCILRETEKCAKEVLSLPMHPTLKDEDIKYIVENVKKFKY